MAELEANIENRIVRYVEENGGLAPKLVIASEAGFPDRVLLLPSGLVVFIEIKRPTKSRTYFMQRRWQERLQRRGFRAEFVESLEDVKAIIAVEKAKAGSVERWRAVVGYEGIYEVSSIGRVRSLDRRSHDVRGRERFKHGKMLRLQDHKAGYPMVSLSRKGKVTLSLVHRLVLEAFIGLCPKNEETRHLDGDPRNNTIMNLCWGTSEENASDSIRHKTQYVRAIRRSDGKEFQSMTAAAESCHGDCRNIQTVCAGRRPKAYGYGWEYIK